MWIEGREQLEMFGFHQSGNAGQRGRSKQERPMCGSFLEDECGYSMEWRNRMGETSYRCGIFSVSFSVDTWIGVIIH